MVYRLEINLMGENREELEKIQEQIHSIYAVPEVGFIGSKIIEEPDE